MLADARAKLSAIEQDLDLARYEPSSIRPPAGWLNRRRAVARALPPLGGLLLVAADQEPAGLAAIARRLERLAETLGNAAELRTGVTATEAADDATKLKPRPMGASAISAAVEAPLARLEQLVANLSENEAQGATDYAPA
jgi:multidrug resistance protein MdtO